MQIRICVEENITKNKTIALDNKRTHYLKNVMRRSIGDRITIFSPLSGEFISEIIELNKKACKLNIIEQTKGVDLDVKTNLHIGFALIKPHRLSILIEKLTELGVERLTPIITEHTYSKHINKEKLKAISIEACEQCERISIPEISDAKKFEEFLREFSKKENVEIYALDERKSQGNNLLNKSIDFEKENLFLIGPEGGFSKKEFEMFNKYNVQSIDLGPLVLRAETACISTASIYNQLLFKGV